MTNKIPILLAEDEPILAKIIKEGLEANNFVVFWCKDGQMAFEVYQEKAPKILVLDVMMPKRNGFSLARQIRSIDEDIPIIFLTAKSQPVDVVEGFSVGGNDYLKKPFTMQELVVRIKNLLNINQSLKNENLNIGDYRFDVVQQLLYYKGKEDEKLTYRESNLLHLLIKNKNRLVEKSIILKKLWGDDDFFSTRSMDVFITRLRKKLKKDIRIKIVSARGYGVKLLCKKE